MESSIVSGLASMTWSTMHMHLQTAHKSDISLPRLRGYACGQQGCQLPEVEIRDTLIGGFGRSKPHRKLHFGTVIPITHNTNTCIRLLYYTFCNMVVITSPIHTIITRKWNASTIQIISPWHVRHTNLNLISFVFEAYKRNRLSFKNLFCQNVQNNNIFNNSCSFCI